MKISRSASIIAALAIGITGALTLSQKSVDAATVVTVTSPNYARLYTSTGELVQNRALAYNTPWLVGKTINLDSGSYYQVATNEYIRTTDGVLSYTPTNTGTNANSSVPSNEAVQQAFLVSINNERASKGIAPLTMDAALNNTAAIRAHEISQMFAHIRPNGTIYASAFPAGSSNEEENIAASTTYRFNNSATQFASNIMDSFRAESGPFTHYTNIMSTDVTKIGLGVYYDSASHWMYVAEDMAN